MRRLFYFLIWLACTAGSAHAESNFSLATGFDHSVGNFGSTQDTKIQFVPVIAKLEEDRFSLKLTVPWVRIVGPGDALPGVGSVNNNNNQNPPPGTPVKTDEDGMGDIVLAGSLLFGKLTPGSVLVELTGKVKFDTADESRGLGTGEKDYAAQVDLYFLVGKTTWFGGIGYQVLGDMPNLKLRDVAYASLGLSHKLSKQTSLGLIWDGRPAVTETGGERSELTAFFVQRLAASWKVQLYGLVGLGKASADYGYGTILIHSF